MHLHPFYNHAVDSHRCRMSIIPGVEGSDYINASLINVCDRNCSALEI